MSKQNIDNLLQILIKRAKEKNDKDALDFLTSSTLGDSLSKFVDIANSYNYNLNVEITSHADFDKLLFSKVANALSKDYLTVYYVNVKTNEYIEYNSNSDYQSLNIEKSGTDFFEQVKRDIPRTIYKDDVPRLLEALSKEKVLESTKDGDTYMVQYRLVINKEPIYTLLKAIKLPDDNDHLIIGVSNIDKYKRVEESYRKVLNDALADTSMFLSSKDYLSILNVNIETGEYIEYSSSKDYKSFEFSTSGLNFFEDVVKNTKAVVHPKYIDRVLSFLSKENLSKGVKKGEYSITYKLIMGDKEIYAQSKAMLLPDDQMHVLIAISNVDKEIRKEKEIKTQLKTEQSLARHDALTGALNKYSYLEKENEINTIISSQNYNFSVVLFDINGLKVVNDTLGHIVGDNYIKDAYKQIAQAFPTSLIYRIGGDEFVVIMDNDININALEYVKRFDKANNKNIKENKVSLAYGYSEYDKNTDTYLSDVLDKADKIMYKHKLEIKKAKIQ